VAALAEMYVQGASTRKVKAITEELCGHSFSAAAISAINTKLDEELAQFRTPAARRSVPIREVTLAWSFITAHEEGLLIVFGLSSAALVATDREHPASMRLATSIALGTLVIGAIWRRFGVGLRWYVGFLVMGDADDASAQHNAAIQTDPAERRSQTNPASSQFQARFDALRTVRNWGGRTNPTRP
jgi:Transposase, Mutator family